MINLNKMGGKQSFDYEKAEDRSSDAKSVQNVIVRVLQIILGFIMAIFHM
jgi:hypothetical protein